MSNYKANTEVGKLANAQHVHMVTNARGVKCKEATQVHIGHTSQSTESMKERTTSCIIYLP